MILILAEKPSLGRNIAAAIEQIPGNARMSRRDGYLEGNGYLVSWAFGHLFSLADVEYYNPSPDGRWSMENLPCFPERFHFELRKGSDKQVDGGVVKQFETIRALCNRPDVDTVVNAGDADREGEIIIRLCIAHAMSEPKAQKRLWLPDQTPETVIAALADLKDASGYDNLAGEGFARTYIDWLYGVNLTRYATLKCGSLMRVGRVIVPIVRAIYERDMAIKNFVPGKYCVIASKEKTNGEVVELVGKTKFKPEEYYKAEQLCAAYNAADAVVTSVKRKKDTIMPGKLFSLSKLQSTLAKKYKMPMKDSLEIVQRLYEQGYLTYPRTNSEYMATAEKDKVKKILGGIAKLGYPVTFKDSKKIFDDSKIESHSAITPTYKIPEKGRLSEAENQVYSTVFRRFVAVFCAKDCLAERTEITVKVGDYEEFSLKGTVILEPGWMKFDDGGMKDKVLPRLEKGDKVNHIFKPTEKETTPPKHYTTETLLNYLKNPFREEKAADDEQAAQMADSVGANDLAEYKAMLEGVELGTEATRTGIIDNARNSGYIQLKKDVYTILPGGIYLVESLDRMGIGMDKYKTCEMGKALKQVFRGQATQTDAVALAEREIGEIFRAQHQGQGGEHDIGMFGDHIGICPMCGKEIFRGRYGYVCGGYKDGCPFQIKTYICGKTISISLAKQLIETGETDVLEGFVSQKSGKTFSAKLKMSEGKTTFVFADTPRPQRDGTPGGGGGTWADPANEFPPIPDEPPAWL
ncbi:MAG: topoisomerase C-terminal repeat-containing protein [Clostridia bacterium]|nr:topoisomerase C-terminal repeat-containing protein [Clostridia bacterium]